jgi:WD40 repeat protein
VLKPQSTNYPLFETQFLAFDNNFDPLNFSNDDINLFIDNQQVTVDSLLIQNSTNSTNLELMITFELSQAINKNDIDFLSQFIQYLKFLPLLSPNKTIHIQIVAFNNNPVLLWDNSINSTPDIQTILNNPSFKRVDLNNFFNNPILSEFINKKNDKSLILITKSNPKLNINFFQKQISDNFLKVLNLNLSNYKQDKYIELAQASNTLYINNSDFSGNDKIFPSLIFLSLGGHFNKIYWQNILDPNFHKLSLQIKNYKNNLDFRLYKTDIPLLVINSNSYYFNVIDVDKTITKLVRIESGSKSIILTSINCDNPKFSIENFSPNTSLKPNSIIDLKVNYHPTSLKFEKAILTINTNTPFVYKINLSGGQKPSLSETEINIQSPQNQDSLFTYENQRITWTGTFPNDEFKIDYNLFSDTLWNNITTTATGNDFIWKVPYFQDSLIKFKISQLDNNLISEKVIQLKGHTKKITSIAWSPNDSLICTASEDGTIILWDTKTGKLIKTLFQSQTKIISGIDWSNNGIFLAISANDTIIKIWNVFDDVLFKEFKSKVKVNLIKFSPNNDFLIGTLVDGNIAVWDFNSTEPKYNIVTGYNKIDAFALNPSSSFSFIATGHSDGKVFLWNYLNGTLYKEFATLPYGVLNISFSPTGNNVAISSFDNKIRIYDINSGYNVLTLFDVNSPIIAINWLANKQFISSSLQNLIKLWSPSDGNLKNIYDQHNSLVYLIQSSHNGKYISSVDESNIIQIWSPDDFPFFRPEILSNQTNYLKILSKKLSIDDILLPKMQIGDTLFYYNSNFIFNNSSFPLILDTISIANSVKGFSILNPKSYFYIDDNHAAPIEIEYIPKDTFNIESQIFTKSTYLTLNSKIRGFVSPRFYDIKKTVIDFGTLALGEEKDSSIFILQNISDHRFKIDSVIFLHAYDNPFKLLNQTIPYELLEKGGAFVPKFKFSPNKVGIFSEVFRIYFQGSTPIDFYLYGKVVAPKIQTDSIFNFDDLICESIKSIELKVKNVGNSNLIIKNVNFDNDLFNEFNIVNISSKNINKQDSAILYIEFIPKIVGVKNVKLKITTNFQENGDTLFVINLTGKKDSISLQLIDKLLTYTPKDDNDQISKTATLKNLGNIIPNIKQLLIPKYFKIDSLTQSIQDIKIYITFLGGFHLTNYIDSLIISDDCDNNYTIKLIANFNNKSAIADVQNNIDFGLLICDNQQDTTITIKNIGQDTLMIQDAFVGSDNFSITFPSVIKIPSFSSQSIKLSFTPKNISSFKDTLILISNAINYSEGIIKIPLNGEKDIFSYNFSADTIHITHTQKISLDTISFQFYNNSNFKIINKFKQENKDFNYITPEMAFLLPNIKTEITAIFKAPMEIGKHIDKFTYTDSCGNEKSIYLIVDVFNSNEFFNISLSNPNPTTSFCYIDINSSQKLKYSFRLIDEIGRTLIQSKYLEDSGNFKIELNLSSFSTGIYILEINTEKGKFIRKIIKL